MNYGIIISNDNDLMLLGKKMISYVISNLEDVVDETLLVSNIAKEGYYQLKDLGEMVDKKGYSLFVPSNMPFIDKELLNSILENHQKNNKDITLTYFNNDKQNIKIICVNNDKLSSVISNINYKNGDYIFDYSELNKNYNIWLYNINFENNICCNDCISLAIAEKKLINKINYQHMKNGVRIENPDTVIIEPNVKIEPNVFIGQCSKITGDSIILGGASITFGSEINNSIIGENTIIRQSVIENSKIGANCSIGPFAHIRMNSNLEGNNRIGNFVEIKNSKVGKKTTAAHLTYIGDTLCKENVNFGCGTVTVNYDGYKKHQTIIGNNVFIGCNTNLIAPIEIGDNAFIAAGSTINKSLSEDDFAIARSYQITKKGYMKKENKDSRK